MTNIELTAEEIKVIQQQLKGEIEVWNATDEQQKHLTSVIHKADALADSLYESARMYFTGQRIREDRSDGDPDWEESFYVLRKTKCPAVLTENFFQDNKEDVAYLLSEDGKQAIVSVHVDGIINYIKSNE